MQTVPESIQSNPAQNVAEAKSVGKAGEPGSQFAAGSLTDQGAAPAPAVWDHAAQRRFKHLAVKEALATITEEELGELESLTTLRRRQTASKGSAENLADFVRATRAPAVTPPSVAPNSGR
jgi:hypothetical protein